jgi:small-conductance mechanosensitive channel
MVLITPFTDLKAWQNTQDKPQDSVEIQKPEPIGVAQIIPAIEDLNNRLNLNYEKIKPTVRLQRVDSLFEGYQTFVDQQRDYALSFIESDPNSQKLGDLIQKWEEYGSQLRLWEQLINEYADRNLRLVESFNDELKVWELTQIQRETEGLPEEMLGNIESSKQKISDFIAEAVSNNRKYLTLATQISSLLGETSEVIDRLYEKKSSEVYSLFYQRHEPLWLTDFSPVGGDQRTFLAINSVKDSISSIKNLVKLRSGKFYLIFIFAALLSFLVFRLRKTLLKVTEIEAVQKNRFYHDALMEHPVAVAIFGAILIAQILTAQNSKLLNDLLTLAILINAVYLIRFKLPAYFKGVVLFSLLIFAMDSLKTYVWFTSPHYRLYLMVEALLVLGILFRYAYPYRRVIQRVSNPLGRFIIRLTPLFFALSFISLVANTLGYTNLADFSLKITTQSGVFSVIFYTLLYVLESLLIARVDIYYARNTDLSLDSKRIVQKKVLKVIRIAIALLFLIFFLSVIDELRAIQAYLSSVLEEPYKVGNLTFTLGSILMFLLILVISYVISRFIAFLLGDEYGILHYYKLPKGVPGAISLVLRYLVIFFGVILALSYINVDLSKFNLMAGALGLGIGFGLQTVISNFVSGLILVFERPILPGDTVEVDNLFGTVKRIGIRSSSIKTFDGAEVVIPNNNLISNDLINWTLSDNIKRVEILIGTSYDSDPNKVLDVLRSCVDNYDYILTDPEPVVLFSDFGDSSLNFRLRFWVNFEMGLQAQSDVSVEIYNRFKTEGIEIPYPQRDIHIKTRNIMGTITPELPNSDTPEPDNNKT